VLEFQPMHQTDFVTVQLGIDKDNDFDFEKGKEPKDLVTLNVFAREIQKTIDGIEKQKLKVTIWNQVRAVVRG
jgi:hypothetical protein